MDVEGSGRGLISGIRLEKERERDYENQNYVFEIKKK